MSRYPGSIFVKKPGARKTYEKEIIMPYNVDKDLEIQEEISELEALAASIRRDAHYCKMSDIFLDNIGTIGGLYRKYTKFTFLPKDSESSKRFNDAIRKTRDAKTVFIRDCECKYKKKVSYIPP